jgi:hypothetical protein
MRKQRIVVETAQEKADAERIVEQAIERARKKIGRKSHGTIGRSAEVTRGRAGTSGALAESTANGASAGNVILIVAQATGLASQI